ncbi:MAG: hypothetical protein K8U03_23260 [Planctomycetia bacterium]|nr:hypothetical protein [Planctomycetia bacterium]
MAKQLSSSAEIFIANVVADGTYASREAVLEAAINALRDQATANAPAPASRLDDVGNYSTIALTPEECARLQGQVSSKAEADGLKFGG